MARLPGCTRRPVVPRSAAARMPETTSRTSQKSFPPCGEAAVPMPEATCSSIRPLDGFQSQGPSMNTGDGVGAAAGSRGVPRRSVLTGFSPAAATMRCPLFPRTGGQPEVDGGRRSCRLPPRPAGVTASKPERGFDARRLHEGTAGGRSSLRPSDPPLEPEDEALHLHRARRHLHHRPHADAGAAGRGVQLRARRSPSAAARCSSSARRSRRRTPSATRRAASACRTSTTAGSAACSRTGARSPTGSSGCTSCAR